MDITQIDKLKKGLERTTNLLNQKRGLWEKYIAGQKYSLKITVPSEFLIFTTYRNKDREKGICADIQVYGEGLEGIICPMKSAKPVANFLHEFSHQNNISLGCLASALNPEYYK